MRKTLFFLLLTPFLLLGAAQHYIQPNLQRCLDKIYQLPEATSLLNEIQKEGKISFTVDTKHEAAKFGAFWDLDSRLICVNPTFHKNDGEMIGSILFEMQNAKASQNLHHLFEQAAQGKISKADYIRGIEYIEFQNSKRAAEMANIGIQRGVLPATASLYTYRDFDEHFFYQQKGGHSQAIGDMFDRIAPYYKNAF